jgi:pilus assembly protein CpaB
VSARRWVSLRPLPPVLGTAIGLRPAHPTIEQRWHAVRVGVRRYRRLLIAGLIPIAVVVEFGRLAPRPPPTHPVVTAARDLPLGEVLTAADLRVLAVPPAEVPSGAVIDVRSVVGQQLSGPLRRGEPLTDVRLDDGPLRRPAAGLVSAPIRLADSQAAQLLRPGERIDVLAASTAVGGGGASGSGGGSDDGRVGGVGSAVVVAADVIVVAIPVAATAAPTQVADVGVEGALVVLATTATQARQLAQAQVSSRLSAVVVG